jgi:hypothetical protein
MTGWPIPSWNSSIINPGERHRPSHDRPIPPLNADERTALESWFHFHRFTPVMKCEGLDDAQAAIA